MVLVLSEWTAFKDHVERWEYMTELYYKVDPASEGVRMRISGGRAALDLTLRKDDPTYQEVQEFLEQHRGKRIEAARDVLVFFS